MDNKITNLEIYATRIRKSIIDTVFSSQSGHPGGSLSCCDIMTTLYFEVLNIDPKNPSWDMRDRFVLSKGHCSPGLYSVLAHRGYFDESELKNFRQLDSFLQGHPDMNKVPGVDMSTGSLGQGFSAACGMAIAAKLDKKDYKVYAILGDGELQEGQIWEAAMAAPHFKLDNLTAFVDYNGLQIDGKISEVMSPEPIADKFKAFGWNIINIDGHDYEQILNSVALAKKVKDMPSLIVAKTIKGKGVSFMENKAEWHGSAPNEEQRNIAISEFDRVLAQLEVKRHE